MKINEIVEKLKYYTPELPKEAITEALKQKEAITPKLLEMLEYTKENLEKIYNEEDDFFGYNYAYFLLAEFKEPKALPYLIDLLNKDEEIVEYMIGEDYPGYVPRLLASTYNGDDKALFNIIENKQINEFIRCSTLQTFAILYLYGVKDRAFLVNYLKKLLDEREENDNSYLYEEIIEEVCHLKLTELTEEIDKILYIIENDEEREDLKNTLKDKSKINRNLYPFKPLYEYIYDTVGIMEEWQCFRYIEDEEFEKSDDYIICQYIIQKRKENYMNTKVDIGRNDLCYCGSGKKYKKCCMNKKGDEELEMSNEEDKLYERLELWNTIEELFDLNNETQLYWKQRTIREKANTEFRLGNKEKAIESIENYLKIKPDWVWGYVEMSDWYDNKTDLENYDLEKSKSILTRAEQIKNMEDMDVIYERLLKIKF